LISTCFDTLQQRIVCGESQPGVRLVERVVSQEFGVSRSVVRESFVRLASCGLVELTPDAGAKVSALNEARVLDAFFFREGVESIAAEQCAMRMSRVETERLVRLAERFEAEYQIRLAGKPDHLDALDVSFHGMISEGSGNHLAQRAWDTAMMHFFRGARMPPDELRDDARRAIVEDHLQIAVAIKAGDAAEAGLRMKQHLQHGRALFIAYSQRHTAVNSAPLLPSMFSHLLRPENSNPQPAS